ncbi:FtsW/RodA/SpoVE family cell cycle protein [Lachnospiraceae bacterium 29-84]
MGRKQMADKRQKGMRYFDYNLLLIVFFLICFGLVVLYSSSAYKGQFVDEVGPAFYLKKQLNMDCIGIAVMLIVSRIDYRFWKKFWMIGYIISLVLCFAVLFVGTELNGAKRWLKIGPISFQPSEIAKVAVILFLATLVSHMKPKVIGDYRTILKLFVMLGLVIGCVVKENLSTAVIICGISVAILFVASPKYKQFFVMGGIVGVVGAVAVLAFGGYRAERIAIWLHPENYPKGFQTIQGLYAIGSGGLFGKGLGNGMQKLGFVPEAQNDMIFSIICEELGLFGAVCVILMFVILLWRFMIIANNAQDLFGALVVTGVFAHIAIQVALNIAVVTNTIPNTGISLPFISYGGTSVIILLAEIGLVLSVSRGIRLEG